MSGGINKKKDAKLDFVISTFGEDYIETNKNEIRYDCPFCEEKRGKSDGDHKFYVNIDTLYYFCFKCETKGKLRISDKLSSLLGKSNSEVYSEILSYVEKEGAVVEKEKEESFYKIPVQSALSRESAREYLLGRGLSEKDIRYYNIRLGGVSDKNFFGRVIVPNDIYKGIWTDMYVGRAYLKSIPEEYKYINPNKSESNGSVFHLSKIPENPERIIITEGVFSAISAGKEGVAVYGKYVSNVQLKRILAKNPKRIYECLDPDAEEQGRKLCKRINRVYSGELYRIPMPEETDPNDMGYEKFQDFLENNSRKFENSLYFDLKSVVG